MAITHSYESILTSMQDHLPDSLKDHPMVNTMADIFKEMYVNISIDWDVLDPVKAEYRQRMRWKSVK